MIIIFFIFIIILIITYIVLSILQEKNVMNINNNRKMLILLVEFFVLVVGLKLYAGRHEIIFFFQSIEYQNIDKYDYTEDIVNNGHITKEGAIKIAKEETHEKRIAKVTCELVKNGTYGYFGKSPNKPTTTFWLITFITGYARGHELNWYFKIDYYTGEILECDYTL